MGRHQGRTLTGQPGAQDVDRDLADRHEALLVALADDPDECPIEREVLEVEPERLRDSQAGGVQQLEEGPIAEAWVIRVVRARRVQQPLDLGDGEGLGQESRHPGRVEMSPNVGRDRALAEREAVEAPDRRGSPSEARRRKARVGWPTPARPSRQVPERRVGTTRPLRRGAPRRGEVGQVAGVGLDRGRREAAFGPEVGQVVVDRPSDRRRAGHRVRDRQPTGTGSPRQASAASSSSRAWASAALPLATGSPPGPGPTAVSPPAVLSRSSLGPEPPPAPAAGPPSIAPSSMIRPSRSSRSTSVTVRPSRSRFEIRKWASAWAAIWGRWGTTRTWWSRASAQRLRPTGSPVRPPIPASTSSNTSVGVASAVARTCLTASATRDTSPPDAIFANERAGSPAFGANVKTISSAPLASKATASPSSSIAGSSGPAVRRPTSTPNAWARNPSVSSTELTSVASPVAAARRSTERREAAEATPSSRRTSSAWRRRRSSSRPSRRWSSAAARSPWASTAASSSPYR